MLNKMDIVFELGSYKSCRYQYILSRMNEMNFLSQGKEIAGICNIPRSDSK